MPASEQLERRATLAFGSIRGVGPATLAGLRSRFGSLAEALDAGPAINEVLRSDARKDLELDSDLRARAERVQARCAELGARILFKGDAEWPTQLADMGSTCPDCLFILGTLGSRRRVALVGTRKSDDYGDRAAFFLSQHVAASGLTVVSGGAEGIDTKAHLGALEAKGSTWAVLGAGFDHLYPRSNLGLFKRLVAEGGALVTESPPAHEVKEGNFPRRNKLVAALSEAVVVVRGAADSGAMITARDARNLKRLLLAVPGQVGDKLSEGPNRLLRSGWGRACGESDDILRALGLAAPLEDVPTAAELNPPQDGAETKAHSKLSAAPRSVDVEPELLPVFQALGTRPLHFDDLLEAAHVSASVLASALTTLELKGLALQKPGKFFIRT
jgi:DNA processing protein